MLPRSHPMNTRADKRDATASSPTWLAQEGRVGPRLSATFARLLRRGRGTWFVWVPLALVLGAGFSVLRGRRYSVEATVVLRVSERAMGGAATILTSPALRGYVQERAFVRRNLIDLMARHPKQFPLVAIDPTAAIDSLLKIVDVTITSNDFIEDRPAEGQLRAARIEVSFRAGQPAWSLTMARELAELIVSSASTTRSERLAQLEAATEAALRQAQGNLDDDGDDGPVTIAQRHAAELARSRLQAAISAAANATLASHAGEQAQALRFEVVDPGQEPHARTRQMAVTDFIAGTVVTLLALWLLAGAFDPRVMDGRDLSDLDITVLAETPPLPRAPWRKSGDRSA